MILLRLSLYLLPLQKKSLFQVSVHILLVFKSSHYNAFTFNLYHICKIFALFTSLVGLFHPSKCLLISFPGKCEVSSLEALYAFCGKYKLPASLSLCVRVRISHLYTAQCWEVDWMTQVAAQWLQFPSSTQINLTCQIVFMEECSISLCVLLTLFLEINVLCMHGLILGMPCCVG